VAVLCACVALNICCVSARPTLNAGTSRNATGPGSASVQDLHALLLDSRFPEASSPAVIAWFRRTVNDSVHMTQVERQWGMVAPFIGGSKISL
jgi:hypothetical protein